MNWLADVLPLALAQANRSGPLLFGLLAIAGFWRVVALILRRERAWRDEFTGEVEREP